MEAVKEETGKLHRDRTEYVGGWRVVDAGSVCVVGRVAVGGEEGGRRGLGVGGGGLEVELQ